MLKSKLPHLVMVSSSRPLYPICHFLQHQVVLHLMPSDDHRRRGRGPHVDEREARRLLAHLHHGAGAHDRPVLAARHIRSMLAV
ncbi:hypothetical protein E2562_018073 [Oryza meyeriana var. granulata]|uniref:Uncharacterized protein n=1 Tax=Oryza meyeriana var. granulata TaxID=110450 RepID=A0A6G1CR49_9ORYZ|nr:hypothetical protein E2562_018073 [Oryza meyeriana var. granulata]